MRSTFKVLFYTKNQSVKNGRVPIMGRITVNGQAVSFSCKKEVSISLWDAKANCANGKSTEARLLNQYLDNIKAQIAGHYQYICDHESFVTAKKVYSRYVGFGDGIHTLLGVFREQLDEYKIKIGKSKAQGTYDGLVCEYRSLVLFLKHKKGLDDINIEELDNRFIEDFYNWMLADRSMAKSTAFERINTMKWLMHIAIRKGWLRIHPFAEFSCMPEYKKRPFLSEEDLQKIIHVRLSYKRQQAIRDMFVFMCFTGLAYADLKEITYKNIHTDSDGGTWLMGNRVKTGVAYVVKLLPIAIELIEKFRGVDDKKISPDRVFPVGDMSSMYDSLRIIGKKCDCSVEVTPHVGRHTFATLALLKGMPLETLQKVLGHKSILSTQVYAELINPKIAEDTDKIREKIGDAYKLVV